MLHLFQRHVASVFFRVFQRYVSSVFSGCMLQVCLSGCYICFTFSHILCMCFIWMLHMVAMIFKCFEVFFLSVSEACFKYFNYLQTYVATVVRWFKVNQVLHLFSPPSAASFRCVLRCQQGILRRHGRVIPNQRRRAFPSCRSGSAGPVWSVRELSMRFDSLFFLQYAFTLPSLAQKMILAPSSQGFLVLAFWRPWDAARPYLCFFWR
jgi:hypothetical protein